ncbi:hypothetical protein JHJ32_07675 [Parapedobacter sp. ISTM3]|uniref:hypothetical protein n=1 Tax=Parapedobacter sp. ISTM3 TaxID=2800130 RepID=UPI001903789A|nr:hypothetical protein [Parapedobacter sp. ISTM3]MBK1439857.1 hypothetical protein [Parapedobacter sp. ISTM3]
MKENDKAEELITPLKSLGFEGDQLKADIVKGMEVGLPFFTVNHRVHFGEELMDFELRFKMPLEGDKPILERYNATFRSAVEIEHLRYSSIDTADLEEQMKRIDWFKYFKDGKGHTAADAERENARKVMRQLDLLDRSKDIAANAIREELIYKYWPKAIAELHRHSAVKPEYDFERSFDSGILAIPNIYLAYHKASGRLDVLLESLDTLGFEEYTGADLYRKLEVILSKDLVQFGIDCFRNGPEGLAEYRITVRKKGYEFEPEYCEVSFIPHPGIAHGFYNGIDSEGLERLMTGIDWKNDHELFRVTGDWEEPRFFPKVNDVQEQLHRLDQDTAGAEIADLLRLKYWIGVTFFEDMISTSAWNDINHRKKETVQFPLEYTAEQMYNLWCGRPVMQAVTVDDVRESTWVWLDRKTKDEQGNPLLKTTTGLTKNELETQLRMIPFRNFDHYPIRDALISGNPVLAKVHNGPDVHIAVNPGLAVLELYTDKMKPIPFNFRFDPDWTPEPTASSGKRQEPVKRKKPNVNKNKGL